jgi:hypothetical protein
MARRPLNGARRVTGDTASHAKYGVGPATDYGADSGDGVYAPFSGHVTHWWSSTGGWTVAVTSGDWKVTLQHNSAYRGPSSGWVKEGTLIALTGNTGSATTGPHVHMWIERARTGAHRQSFEDWLREFMGWQNTARAGGRVSGPHSTITSAVIIPEGNPVKIIYKTQTQPGGKPLWALADDEAVDPEKGGFVETRETNVVSGQWAPLYGKFHMVEEAEFVALRTKYRAGKVETSTAYALTDAQIDTLASRVAERVQIPTAEEIAKAVNNDAAQRLAQ